MNETETELGVKAMHLSGDIEPIELPNDDFFSDVDFPTNARFADIPFELVAPTVHRQTIIIHRTIIVNQPTPTPQPIPTYSEQPTPTYTPTPIYSEQPTPTYTPTHAVDMVRVGKAIGGTVGYVAFGTVKIVWGIFSGIVSILASMIQTCFEGSNDGYRQSVGDMHKWPDTRKMHNGGSINTVRDININVHIGDNK